MFCGGGSGGGGGTWDFAGELRVSGVSGLNIMEEWKRKMATIFQKHFTSNVEMTAVNPPPELVLCFWFTERGGG